MGDFRISGKNVITQSGTDEPVLASNVTLGTGIIKPGANPNAATSTLSCTTASSTTITTADTSSLSLGMAVSGTGIPSGAHIATIPNSTTFTISAAATNSATNTLTFRTGITDSKLNFAGTVNNNTFLRSDKTWATAGSPSITDGGNATAITINSDEEVTFEKRSTIPSIKPKSNQNLTGTYAANEMIMGDKFTLTGNLTINDNLVLASLSGSGQDIIIEDDGNGRTITTAGKVISCTTTNTDATVTTADTSDLRAGTGVTGTGIPSGATIASVTNATTFELSAAATASGTVNLTFDTAVFEAGEFLGTAAVPNYDDIPGTIPLTALGGAGLGRAQSWSDMTSSRAKDTTYTNSTGQPIYISIICASGTGGDVRIQVGAVNPPNAIYTNSSNGRSHVSAIVPNGHTYRLNTAGAGAPLSWMEVR